MCEDDGINLRIFIEFVVMMNTIQNRFGTNFVLVLKINSANSDSQLTVHTHTHIQTRHCELFILKGGTFFLLKFLFGFFFHKGINKGTFCYKLKIVFVTIENPEKCDPIFVKFIEILIEVISFSVIMILG